MKRDEIHRNLKYDELIHFTQAVREGEGKDEEEDESGRAEVPTGAMLMHEAMNHMQEMGWDEVSSEMKNSGCAVR